VKPVIATMENILVIRALGRLGEKDRETLGDQLLKLLG